MTNFFRKHPFDGQINKDFYCRFLSRATLSTVCTRFLYIGFQCCSSNWQFSFYNTIKMCLKFCGNKYKTFYHCLVVKVYCWGKLVLTCLVMSLKLVLFFVLFCFVFDGYPFKFPFSWKNSLYICFTKVFVISYYMVWHTEEVWLLNWIFRKNDGIRRFSWGDVSWM